MFKIEKHYAPVRHKIKEEPAPAGPFTAELLDWWRQAMQNAGFNARVEHLELIGEFADLGEWEMVTSDGIGILVWKVIKPGIAQDHEEWHYSVAVIPPVHYGGYWDPPDQDPPDYEGVPVLETWGDVVIAYLKLMVEMEYERLCEWAQEQDLRKIEEEYEKMQAEGPYIREDIGEHDLPEHEYDPCYFELMNKRSLRRIGP